MKLSNSTDVTCYVAVYCDGAQQTIRVRPDGGSRQDGDPGQGIPLLPEPASESLDSPVLWGSSDGAAVTVATALLNHALDNPRRAAQIAHAFSALVIERFRPDKGWTLDRETVRAIGDYLDQPIITLDQFPRIGAVAKIVGGWRDRRGMTMVSRFTDPAVLRGRVTLHPYPFPPRY